MSCHRRRRLTAAAGLAATLALGATVARADCEDEHWESCGVLKGSAMVIRQPAMPQLGRITIGEDEVSGFGIGVSVGYRIARLVLTGDFVGIYKDELDMTRAGLSAQYMLVHLPTSSWMSTLLYVEAGIGRQAFRWRDEQGDVERTLQRSDMMVGLGAAESFSFGKHFSYRLSLGVRALSARSPLPFDRDEPGKPRGAGVDIGYLIIAGMSFDI